MAMKLESLSQLYNNMKAQGLTKTKFDFRFRTLLFSVIYVAEQFPHELLFGCRTSNLFFVVRVSKNFEVSTHLGENYSVLVKALGLHSDPSNPFSPNVLFEGLKAAIPLTTTAANTPNIVEIASLSRDVENADKIYFIGWLNHDGISSKPSLENLAKTKRICGQVAYETCIQHHISSRWTDDIGRALPYTVPVV